MDFRKSAIILSFAAAMSLLNTTLFAIDMSKSEVIKTTGKVAVKKTNSPEFKKLNSNLKLSGSLKNLDGGDKVRTYNDSTADLALKDTCILMVKEQSLFEVPKILTQKDLKVLKAQQGSVLFKVAKGSNFQVQTADVICGVKGTMFSVTVSDGLHTMLETPGLQLGYATAGGSAIDVYEGQVEVTHKKTNKKINLTSGQGAIINKDSSDIISAAFNPSSKLNSMYGSATDELLKATGLKELTDINVIRDYKSRYDSEVARSINKNTNTNKIYGENKYGVNESDVNNVKTIFSKGKQYKADFSRLSTLNSEKTFYNNSFSEVYLGKNTLAACKAANGSGSLIAEPGQNGLVVLQGNGLVKMDIFNTAIGIDNELLANIYENNNEVITAVRNNRNNLYWREPGSLDLQKVPSGDVAYVYNRNTCKGQWVKAAPGSIPAELASYNFSVINSMNQEKKQVEKQNKEKKKEAAKNTVNKIGNVLKKKGKWF